MALGPNIENDSVRQRLRLLGLALFASMASFALTVLAHRFCDQGAPAIWPPNAAILALLLSQPSRRWLALLAAGWAGQLAADAAQAAIAPFNLAVSASNTLECFVCALGMRWLAPGPFDLTRIGRQLIFAVTAFAAAMLASGGVATFLASTGQSYAWIDFARWTLSDALGLLIVTPAILALNRGALARFTSPRTRWRNLGLLAFVGIVTWVTFSNPQLQLRFLTIPVLVLVAFNAETAGAALGLLLVGAVAMPFAKDAAGGLIKAPIETGGLFVQILLLVGATSAFPVAAAMEHRRRMTVELDAFAREFKLLADYSSDVIMRLASDGTILYISPACRRYGYEPDEMLGRLGFELIDTDQQREALAAIAALSSVQAEREQSTLQYRVKCANGEFVWMQSCSRRLPAAETGGVQQIVVQLRDITALKAMEDELRRKRDEAEAAAAAKGAFLASMSHEIRTPLTGVIGFARLLNQASGLPSEAAAWARRILTASESLLTVVNDILDLSKIDAGRFELDPQPFEPGPFLVETVELVRAQAEAKGVGLHIDLASDLPDGVMADSSRLRQILLNLLTNAIKFTDVGEVRVLAEWSADDVGQLRVAVRDTGVGVAPEKLDRLFRQFSQADGSISRRYGGTGLGLSISKSLVELMGGVIEVESIAGKGSTFRIILPAPVAALPKQEPEAELHETSIRPARILVADDVHMNRELVRAMLSVVGHELVDAVNGVQAVEAAAHERFDLILMDMQMPAMDGLEASRRIRSTPGPNADTPIVALSANVMEEQLIACRAAGMDDHIGKPIGVGELMRKVAYWADRRSQSEPELAEAV